jgi:hypothetical protein
MITRRALLQSMTCLAATAGTCGSLNYSSARAAPAGSPIRVLDADFDVRPFLPEMKKNGVIAIGRYYSRDLDANCNWPGKMLSRDEADAILDSQMAILTVFQYCNGRRRFHDEPAKGATDADWALRRASEIDQPKEAPVYFGVDFDPMPDQADCNAANRAMGEIRRYFEQVRAKFQGGGRRVGVYGPGKVCAKLKEWGLAEYFWLSASIGHWGHPEFYNSRQWHLFQNRTDLHLYSPLKTRRVDTDVTNPEKPDFGQWRRAGAAPRVDEATATAVLKARRFLKTGTVYLERDAATGEMKNARQLVEMQATLGGGRSCRLVQHFDKGVAGINLREADGIDAFCRLGDLTPSLEVMPTVRNRASCEV